MRRPIAADVAAALAIGALAVALAAGAAFASGRRGRPAPPPDDVVVRFPVAGTASPGRVEFSHVRHFGALGEKTCTTCHSPEMGLLRNPAYASRALDPAAEAHAPASLGRYCATCHNGTTRLSQVGRLGGRPDAPIFTATRTGRLADCERCHAPRDHGADFTRRHEDVAERSGGRACLACHAQDWRPRDRRAQADLLAAERTLAANPDDAAAALVVGPNNFCVYCHRADREWLERD